MKGCCCAETVNHFTSFLYNYNCSIKKFGLTEGFNYFHDGCKNNGRFIRINENLIQFFDKHTPYILIYKKLNTI